MPNFWQWAGMFVVLGIAVLMFAFGADKHPKEK